MNGGKFPSGIDGLGCNFACCSENPDIHQTDIVVGNVKKLYRDIILRETVFVAFALEICSAAIERRIAVSPLLRT
ncbi:hypothetical protein D3C86_1602160 [compost metagenome]